MSDLPKELLSISSHVGMIFSNQKDDSLCPKKKPYQDMKLMKVIIV